MTTIDERIEAALRDEPLDDPNLRDMLTDVFRSRLMWLNILTALITFCFFGLGVYCAYRLIEAKEAVGAVQWGVAATFCMISVGLLKTWFWQLMHRNTVLRAIKRIELHLARSSRAQS